MRRAFQGLQLPAHKQLSRAANIIVAPVPDTLVLPLDQHRDVALQPCVQVGDKVRMGQLIAQATSELGACLHSPVSGTVLAIEVLGISTQATMSMAVKIANDHLDTREPAVHCDWQALEPLALCAHLARGGMVGLGGAVFPTATKLAAHTRNKIDYLLINGVECEPFISCDDALMCERAAQVIQGVQILMHASQAQRCKIIIETDKPDALNAMRAALQIANDTRIEVQAIATAYPNGDEGQLMAQVLDREIPRGGLPADVGVVVQNVATAYACARWLNEGEPLLSRIVTVTGATIAQPANLEVRIGTPMHQLLIACGGNRAAGDSLLIMGGAMMGRSLPHDDFPVVKATNCLIVSPAAALKPVTMEMPCIRCGECAQACPVNLLPQQLLIHARNDNRLALQELGLADCIECGCCDYVCPSNITLAACFHAAKQLE